MKQIAIVILCALMLNGCAPCKHLSTNSKDSVRIEYRTRVEYVPDTVVVEIPAQSEKITTRDTSSHLENDYALTDARINGDGTLFHSLATKPQKKPVLVKRPIEYRDSIVYRDRAVEKIVSVERELSWWQKTQIKGFWVAVIIFIFFSLIRRFI